MSTKVVYDQDLVGRMYERNAMLLRLLISCREVLEKFGETKLSQNDTLAVAKLKVAIDEYHMRGR